MENKLYLKIRFIKVKLSFPSAKQRLINLYKRYIELAYFLFAIRLHSRDEIGHIYKFLHNLIYCPIFSIFKTAILHSGHTMNHFYIVYVYDLM